MRGMNSMASNKGADHSAVKRKLSIAKGQLEGIAKMIDHQEYCIDISNQIMATIALLKSANEEIISKHLRHCVLHCQDEVELEQKMDEIESVLKRMD